jgi:hypothetical protein
MRFTKEFVLPGYPRSRPFRKPTIWKLLNVAEEIGVTLTEEYGDVARFVRVRLLLHIQKASISDWGNKEDQVIDYAKRRSISTDKAMKWLGPNIVKIPKPPRGGVKGIKIVQLKYEFSLLWRSGKDYESNTTHRSSRRNLILRNYSATKGKHSGTVIIDPLMEFKPPFIDVTTSREEFIYVDKGNGLLDKTNQNAPRNTWNLCFNKT